MQHIQLTVHGMTCGGCAARLQRVLQASAGVAAALVVLDGGRVEVEYDAARIDAAAIERVIADAGFGVVPR
ncbi:heavy-metal-associated domain-containing protein [Xanthomonas translucens]|uniref:heavy-metal-associated domain-containing protein n=1 Tax=Xanthomonas campestris pv. translucens TaxID=343 RepID=UPI00064214BB|nr:heavy-metal-associated domain-containing protein [Xanthomonas translucens]AKK69011.1 copper chaperone [Xanthomonas translucens pv. undulosa]AVY67968.1 copper chaperone [Xanthomonas translucens pv. undulosa]MCT8269214.1 heavy-metal-associated domain-containing protein [Xanthomonas translucens pv. undulosa]QSQ42552.1 heavy-metal-associated domain-containing protein [Xanthomonas translucens pv. translucens]QSQ49600.1 heavy-metal-associated domain-containing protein [Xanthomonas translucens pv.